MLDNLLEKESYTFREPFEIRMEELSYNISIALALLDYVIPMLKAADAGQRATQAVIAPEITSQMADTSWVSEFVASVPAPEMTHTPEPLAAMSDAEVDRKFREMQTAALNNITDEEVDRKFRQMQAHEATQKALANAGPQE